MSGLEIGKKLWSAIRKNLECHQNLFGQSKKIDFQLSLSFGHPNTFGMLVLHFGLPFGTWHAAILRPVCCAVYVVCHCVVLLCAVCCIAYCVMLYGGVLCCDMYMYHVEF